MSKIELVYQDEDHRSVIAAKDIKAGETVTVIPENMLLTFDKCKKSQIG